MKNNFKIYFISILLALSFSKGLADPYISWYAVDDITNPFGIYLKEKIMNNAAKGITFWKAGLRDWYRNAGAGTRFITVGAETLSDILLDVRISQRAAQRAINNILGGKWTAVKRPGQFLTDLRKYASDHNLKSEAEAFVEMHSEIMHNKYKGHLYILSQEALTGGEIPEEWGNRFLSSAMDIIFESAADPVTNGSMIYASYYHGLKTGPGLGGLDDTPFGDGYQARQLVRKFNGVNVPEQGLARYWTIHDAAINDMLAPYLEANTPEWRAVLDLNISVEQKDFVVELSRENRSITNWGEHVEDYWNGFFEHNPHLPGFEAHNGFMGIFRTGGNKGYLGKLPPGQVNFYDKSTPQKARMNAGHWQDFNGFKKYADPAMKRVAVMLKFAEDPVMATIMNRGNANDMLFFRCEPLIFENYVHYSFYGGHQFAMIYASRVAAEWAIANMSMEEMEFYTALYKEAFGIGEGAEIDMTRMFRWTGNYMADRAISNWERWAEGVTKLDAWTDTSDPLYISLHNAFQDNGNALERLANMGEATRQQMLEGCRNDLQAGIITQDQFDRIQEEIIDATRTEEELTRLRAQRAANQKVRPLSSPKIQDMRTEAEKKIFSGPTGTQDPAPPKPKYKRPPINKQPQTRRGKNYYIGTKFDPNAEGYINPNCKVAPEVAMRIDMLNDIDWSALTAEEQQKVTDQIVAARRRYSNWDHSFKHDEIVDRTDPLALRVQQDAMNAGKPNPATQVATRLSQGGDAVSPSINDHGLIDGGGVPGHTPSGLSPSTANRELNSSLIDEGMEIMNEMDNVEIDNIRATKMMKLAGGIMTGLTIIGVGVGIGILVYQAYKIWHPDYTYNMSLQAQQTLDCIAQMNAVRGVLGKDSLGNYVPRMNFEKVDWTTRNPGYVISRITPDPTNLTDTTSHLGLHKEDVYVMRDTMGFDGMCGTYGGYNTEFIYDLANINGFINSDSLYKARSLVWKTYMADTTTNTINRSQTMIHGKDKSFAMPKLLGESPSTGQVYYPFKPAQDRQGLTPEGGDGTYRLQYWDDTDPSKNNTGGTYQSKYGIYSMGHQWRMLYNWMHPSLYPAAEMAGDFGHNGVFTDEQWRGRPGPKGSGQIHDFFMQGLLTTNYHNWNWGTDYPPDLPQSVYQSYDFFGLDTTKFFVQRGHRMRENQIDSMMIALAYLGQISKDQGELGMFSPDFGLDDQEGVGVTFWNIKSLYLDTSKIAQSPQEGYTLASSMGGSNWLMNMVNTESYANLTNVKGVWGDSLAYIDGYQNTVNRMNIYGGTSFARQIGGLSQIGVQCYPPVWADISLSQVKQVSNPTEIHSYKFNSYPQYQNFAVQVMLLHVYDGDASNLYTADHTVEGDYRNAFHIYVKKEGRSACPSWVQGVFADYCNDNTNVDSLWHDFTPYLVQANPQMDEYAKAITNLKAFYKDSLGMFNSDDDQVRSNPAANVHEQKCKNGFLFIYTPMFGKTTLEEMYLYDPMTLAEGFSEQQSSDMKGLVWLKADTLQQYELHENGLTKIDSITGDTVATFDTISVGYKNALAVCTRILGMPEDSMKFALPSQTYILPNSVDKFDPGDSTNVLVLPDTVITYTWDSCIVVGKIALGPLIPNSIPLSDGALLLPKVDLKMNFKPYETEYQILAQNVWDSVPLNTILNGRHTYLPPPRDRDMNKDGQWIFYCKDGDEISSSNTYISPYVFDYSVNFTGKISIIDSLGELQNLPVNFYISDGGTDVYLNSIYNYSPPLINEGNSERLKKQLSQYEDKYKKIIISRKKKLKKLKKKH